MLDKFDNKKNPFKVPENYFQDFNTRIMEQLPAKQTAKIVPLWKKVLPWTAIAAVVCGVIFTVAFYDSENHGNTIAETEGAIPVNTSVHEIALAQVSEDDFYKFVEDEVNAADLKELMSYEY